jgi:hypothetical protein
VVERRVRTHAVPGEHQDGPPKRHRGGSRKASASRGQMGRSGGVRLERSPPRGIAQPHVDQEDRAARSPYTDIGGDSAQERPHVIHERKGVSCLRAGRMHQHLDATLISILQGLQQLCSRSAHLARGKRPLVGRSETHMASLHDG